MGAEKAEIRWDPSTGAIAIKTGPNITVGEWFVFHPNNGGHYSTGEREKVAEWLPYDNG